MKDIRSPLGCQLIHYRDRLQSKLDLDTLNAQIQCASMAGVQLFIWQSWEASEGTMPAELWLRLRNLVQV